MAIAHVHSPKPEIFDFYFFKFIISTLNFDKVKLEHMLPKTNQGKVNRFVYTLIVEYESNCDRVVELLWQYLQSIFAEWHWIDDV